MNDCLYVYQGGGEGGTLVTKFLVGNSNISLIFEIVNQVLVGVTLINTYFSDLATICATKKPRTGC